MIIEKRYITTWYGSSSFSKSKYEINEKNNMYVDCRQYGMLNLEFIGHFFAFSRCHIAMNSKNNKSLHKAG